MRKSALIVIAALLSLGTGCRDAADRAGSGIVAPIAVPINALESSKRDLVGVQADINRQGEAASPEQVTVALVLTENAQLPSGAVLGKMFGCGDRVAFSKIPRVSDVGDAVRDALTSLFAIKDPAVAGLHDSLAYSALEAVRTSRADDGTFEVRLRGRLVSSGTCDDPRLKIQVEETVRRLEPKFRIILNDTESAWRCFGDMSGNCK